MAKGSIISDTFEQLAELGQTTAKKTAQSVAQTLNPLNALTSSEKASSSASRQRQEMELRANSHTPLDYARLNARYNDQDNQKVDALRNRLFQMVKQDEERLLERKKQEQKQKGDQEEEQHKQKEKNEGDQKHQEDESLPKGKQRKGMFSPKKKSMEQLTERKASASKN